MNWQIELTTFMLTVVDRVFRIIPHTSEKPTARAQRDPSAIISNNQPAMARDMFFISKHVVGAWQNSQKWVPREA
jgi:hypothetical protein